MSHLISKSSRGKLNAIAFWAGVWSVLDFFNAMTTIPDPSILGSPVEDREALRKDAGRTLSTMQDSGVI